MNRLESICNIVDRVLLEQSDLEHRRNGYVHLYGVSQFCSLLALKHGLDVELCAVAGMLHDIWTYKASYSVDHAKLGSIEARKILNEVNCFSEEEIDIIYSSISKHSNKQDINSDYDEMLKDADVLQHYLYNINFAINENEKDRLDILLKELGVNQWKR